MAIWPFNRKKKQNEALPEEVQEYYESGRKQQTGMAWLLALGTLVVTVLLATVLFFGGRWIYQKVTGNDEPDQPTTQQTENQEQAGEGQSQTPSDTDSDDNEQGSSSTNTDQASTPATQTNTPTTGPSEPGIPDTGPGPGGLQ